MDPKQGAALLLGGMVLTLGVTTVVMSRFGRGRELGVGVFGLALGMAGIGAARGPWALGAAVLGLGVGAGMVSASVLTCLQARVPEARRGVALGWLQLAGDVGGVLGPVVGSALFGAGVGVPYEVTAVLLVVMLPLVWRVLGRTEEGLRWRW